MTETAILLSLALPGFLLVYTAFQFRDQHWPMKLLMTGVGLSFLLGIPFTGYMFAKSNGYPRVAGYLIWFELAAVIVFVVFVFYLIWSYIQDTGMILSGADQEGEFERERTV